MNTRTLAISTLLVAAGCGGSTSTAELYLMDAPPPGVTAVNIHIASMQVHVAPLAEARDADPNDGTIDDDGYWQSLAVDRSIDLVTKQGESAADVLGQLPLPEGKITQIRLVIDTTKANTATKNGVVCNLDTAKVAKKGVKINHPFKAFQPVSGKTHQVYVDFELDKSLKEKGDCFELDPKIKLHKIKTDGKDEAI